MAMNGQPEPGKRRMKIRLLCIIIAVICISILVFVSFRIWAAHRVKTKLDAIRADGLPVTRQAKPKPDAMRAKNFPMTLQELDESYPSVPPGENAADIFRAVDRKLKTVSVRDPRWNPGTQFKDYDKIVRELQDVEQIPSYRSAKLPPLGEPLSESLLESISEQIDNRSEALALIHEAASLSACRYPIKITDGIGLRLPHLSLIRERATLPKVEALLAAERSNPERSARAIRTLFGLGHSLAEEPLLLSQLVRMKCAHIACGTLEHVLNRISFSDEDLVRLAASVAAEDDTETLTRVLVSERCAGISVFNKTNPLGVADRSGGKQRKRNAARYQRSGRKDLDFSAYLEIMELYIEQSQRPFPARFPLDDEVRCAINGIPEHCVLTRKMTSDLGRAFQEDSQNIATVRCAMLAVAIERYRLAHATIPQNLDDLVPEFIEAIPLDPFDGKPLRFKKQEKGYIAYSIGINQVDDGGMVTDPENDSKGQMEPLDMLFTLEK